MLGDVLREVVIQLRFAEVAHLVRIFIFVQEEIYPHAVTLQVKGFHQLRDRGPLHGGLPKVFRE
jgi:hypothetical protein